MNSIYPYDAINLYHDLLANDHLTSTQEMLAQATEKHGLSFGTRPVCTVLRPFFITEETYNYVGLVSTLVMRGVAGLGRRLVADAALRAEMDLNDIEEEIIAIDRNPAAPDVSGRLDGFLSEAGDFNFVEYNAESPGGLAYGDALSDAFSQMPIMQAFGQRFAFRAFPVRDMVFEALLSAYHRQGGQGLPNIAIVDWRGVGTYNEFLLMKSHFETRGCRVRIADPDELEYRENRLFIADFPVDLVYKRVVIGEFLAKYGLKHPLVDAVRAGAVCIANSFRVQMLYKKMIFALLSDPAYNLNFEPEVAQAFARHIPWARKVCERKTVYGDRTVDLVEFIAANRERLVLKPNSEYGGKGVTLGWECNSDEWSAALRNALNDSYLVQERVPLGREVYPSVVEGELRFDERFLDLDPYVWHGENIEGCGVRLSRLALLNVSAGGGSATPMFVIREK
ncbi:MAG TPA: hypothetical protein VNO70_08040 [Blastocatellia bacterium]|nr:hypothetical protein [Blastocatellia bacterium]